MNSPDVNELWARLAKETDVRVAAEYRLGQAVKHLEEMDAALHCMETAANLYHTHLRAVLLKVRDMSFCLGCDADRDGQVYCLEEPCRTPGCPVAAAEEAALHAMPESALARYWSSLQSTKTLPASERDWTRR